MKIKAMIMMLLLALPVSARQENETDAVLRVLGVLSAEDAHAEDVDRVVGLMRNPVSLSHNGLSSLEASGLFTPYQLASLADYMKRHGPICSLTELSSIDGFSDRFVEVIRPFISLGNQALAGGNTNRGFDGTMDVKTALKHTGGVEWNSGIRARAEIDGLMQAALSASRKYDRLCLYSGGIAIHHRYGKVLLGDFNARFGQGLCLWNTVSFSSLTSPSAFMKRSSGLSLSNSYTGSYAMTGVAGDLSLGRWRCSAMLSMPGIKHGLTDLMPAANVTRYFRFGHISATHMMQFSNVTSPYFRIPQMKSSIDASVCLSGINLFSELSYDWVSSSSAFVAGVESGLGESLRVASLVRYMPYSNDHGAAFAGEFVFGKHECIFSSDVKYDPRMKPDQPRRFQIKGQLKWRWNLSESVYSEFRLSERYRTWGLPFRTDARADFCCSVSLWTATIRLNLLDCDGLGLLGYAETGCKAGEWLSVHLRQGIFRIDDWDDRIYVYERDAPGNFNVPAFYGRGVWTSLYMKSRPLKWLAAYLRASYVGYPFMHDKKKPGKAELKLQLSLHF